MAPTGAQEVTPSVCPTLILLNSLNLQNYCSDLQAVFTWPIDIIIGDIIVGNGINLTTMFGLLLCYPVVYYYDTNIEGNCLSNRDLTVFSMGYNKLWPSCFSVPENLPTAIKQANDWVHNLKASYRRS